MYVINLPYHTEDDFWHYLWSWHNQVKDCDVNISPAMNTINCFIKKQWSNSIKKKMFIHAEAFMNSCKILIHPDHYSMTFWGMYLFFQISYYSVQFAYLRAISLRVFPHRNSTVKILTYGYWICFGPFFSTHWDSNKHEGHLFSLQSRSVLVQKNGWIPPNFNRNCEVHVSICIPIFMNFRSMSVMSV